MKTTIKVTTNGYSKKEIKISEQELLKLLGGKEDEEVCFSNYKNGTLTYDIAPKEKIYYPSFEEYMVKELTICSYNYLLPVIGDKISAIVFVSGYAFIDTDEDEGFSVLGVQPSGFCGFGKTTLKALLSFKKSLLSILLDMIEEADSFDDFKEKLKTFYAEDISSGDLKILKEMLDKPAGKIIITHNGFLDNEPLNIVALFPLDESFLGLAGYQTPRVVVKENSIISTAFIEETV